MTMARRPRRYSDAGEIATRLVERLHGHIVLALPLGLGKANRIANALYRHAAEDPAISLTILTALTLESPRGVSLLQRRFVDPLRARLFAGYPEPEWVAAQQRNNLPDNIEISEFFYPAGRWLQNPAVQRSYVSANYTHVVDTLLERNINVVAQMVAADGDSFSLSCNADLTPDLLSARASGQADFLLLGEVHADLPFMYGDAELEACEFSCLLEGLQCEYPLFAPPKPAVTMADYAAGFRIASLVPDGGTLQIGIGSIGDAVAQVLVLRQQHNEVFEETVACLSPGTPATDGLTQTTPFNEGLFGVSEMLVDSFLPLMDAGVVKREVDGALLHAAFFLGPGEFYRSLRDMPEQQRRRIRMKPVSWVNSLYRNEEVKREARVNARFVNNAMMATLMGAVVSDGLEDGRVVSGVGGQYDFVAQAFALDGARSVITLNATRRSRGKVRSNILWSYGHQTIPRHLRDIIVTEYGIADLRGKSDADVIAAMLTVADSRFQAGLLAQAKRAGKIAADYEIPEPYRNNTPQRIAAMLRPAQQAGYLPPYPFGSDFTETEQRLIPALEQLKFISGSRLQLARQLVSGFMVSRDAYSDCLARLGLDKPRSFGERLYRRLVLAALSGGSG